MLAIALDRNQIPIRNETWRAGAALVTNDSPVGEMHSSPNVSAMYVALSQNIDARCCGVVPWAPKTMNTNPAPRRSSASQTFVGWLGFMFRFPSQDQSAANTGASTITASGPTDWNHVAGISHEPM